MISQQPTGDAATDRALTAIEARLLPHLTDYADALAALVPTVPEESKGGVHAMLAHVHNRIVAIHSNGQWRARRHGLDPVEFMRDAT